MQQKGLLMPPRLFERKWNTVRRKCGRMRMNTAIGKFFTCLAALLLIALPAAPAFASEGSSVSYTTRNVVGITQSTDDTGSSQEAPSAEEENDGSREGEAEEDGIMPLSLDDADDIMPLSDEPSVLAVPDEDPASPTVAEREQSGPKTLDSSKEAISQAATHIATPERALTAKDATVAVGDPSASANLKQTGDSFMEGAIVALGGIVIVVLCLLVYRFRKS